MPVTVSFLVSFKCISSFPENPWSFSSKKVSSCCSFLLIETKVKETFKRGFVFLQLTATDYLPRRMFCPPSHRPRTPVCNKQGNDALHSLPLTKMGNDCPKKRFWAAIINRVKPKQLASSYLELATICFWNALILSNISNICFLTSVCSAWLQKNFLEKKRKMWVAINNRILIIIWNNII